MQYLRNSTLKKVVLIICVVSIVTIFTYGNNKEEEVEYHLKYHPSLYKDKSQAQVIIEITKFAERQTEEDDPELIKFVQTLIVPPSTKKYNLNFPNKTGGDYSQDGQSKYIESLLKHTTGGFYIEAGGYDGEAFSNTLYFELNLAWNGILIEPIPDLFKGLISKNRKAFAINACISKNKPMVAKFRVGGALSGAEDAMDGKHKNRLKNEYPIDHVVYVPCFSLNTIMKALGVKKIDFFSLDVEGGEYDVLKTIDFKRLDIKTFAIEHNGRSESKNQYRQLFKDLIFAKYSEVKVTGQDSFFVKN